VELPPHFDYAHCWTREKHFDFDLSAFGTIAENNAYIARFDTHLAFAAERAGLLHGFCGWFEVDRGGGVALSASPYSRSTIWRQVYFPLEEAAAVEPGSEIELDFGIVVEPAETVQFRWNTEVTPAGGGEKQAFQAVNAQVLRAVLKEFIHRLRR